MSQTKTTLRERIEDVLKGKVTLLELHELSQSISEIVEQEIGQLKTQLDRKNKVKQHLEKLYVKEHHKVVGALETLNQELKQLWKDKQCNGFCAECADEETSMCPEAVLIHKIIKRLTGETQK